MNKRYLVTAALPYANGGLHIGHLAGAYLPADSYVRYLRLRGHDVAFVCGSDEHGAAITIKAKKEGTTPQKIVDKYHGVIKESFEKIGVDFDIYHRTSSPEHHTLSQDLFKQLLDAGKFELKTTNQYYDQSADQFLADRYITGTCPNCANDSAYGDQCEKCGSTLSPTELINPVSTLSGNTPVLRETTHWYLPLDKYEGWLREWILEGKKDTWRPAVYGQCKSWIETGLQARAITRDLDWGVKVPVEQADGKVLYVWFDAPIGYITATQAWADKAGKDWEIYWKDEDTKLVHFVGKDNIVFHCIIFPVILKALGGYILPDNVPANEFLNLEGRKLSTSRNWAVWVDQYLQDFPNQQDSLRYVLTSIAPQSKDSEFTWKDFQQRVNSELAGVLGNFINRVLVLTTKYCNGKTPPLGQTEEIDQGVQDVLFRTPDVLENLLEGYQFREALNETMNVARLGNKYLTDTAPWTLAKDPVNIERVQTILHTSLQLIASLSVWLKPFLPHSAKQIESWLNYESSWFDSACPLLEVGMPVAPNGNLFLKIEAAQVEAQVAKLG